MLHPGLEEFVARLTSSAYQVTLEHGLQAPFIDVELALWQALRTVVVREVQSLERKSEQQLRWQRLTPAPPTAEPVSCQA